MDWNQNPVWVPLSEINGGKQFESGDGVVAVDLVSIVQNLQVLYNTHTEGDYIDIGTVSVTTVSFDKPAAVSIVTQRDPEDARVLLNFTFEIPRGYPALTYGQYYYSTTAPQVGSSITQPTTEYNRTATIGDQLLFVYVHTSGSTETAYMCSATVINVTSGQVTMQISNLVRTTQTGVVYYDKQQELTEDQQKQARSNIGADSANIVPVRYNGGYWSTYGGQSAKAGDLALIINNAGSTGYQKGCLYKVSSAGGSSMSLSPTKVADWVSARAIGDESGENLWELISALDAKINETKFYVSPTSEDPAEIYGGDWEKIEGRLLMGANASFPALNTGGNSQVTLQYQNMPQHNHGVNIAKDSGIVNGHMQLSNTGNTHYFSDSSGYFLGVTTQAGDGAPFSIMPPYFALYMWYRLP